MRVFLSAHAIQRAHERVISPALAKQLFSKALHEVKKGKRGVKQFGYDDGRTKTVWNGWQFVHAPAKWQDDNGTLCDGVALITVYPTVAFHTLKMAA